MRPDGYKKLLPLYYVMSKKNPLAQKEDCGHGGFLKGERPCLLSLQELFAGAPSCGCLNWIAKQEHVLQKARYYENVNSLELAISANEGIHIGFKRILSQLRERLVMHPMPNSGTRPTPASSLYGVKKMRKRLLKVLLNFRKYYN